MQKEVQVGDVVKHKLSETPDLVVFAKRTEHGYIVYECRWYNEKTGSFDSDEFYASELRG